ncbi:hypothetical protein TNCV_1234391 [Trichonephila clavipes]|nr:hypothetical protein TNCV_1234391 [Trichonephila clavipes]
MDCSSSDGVLETSTNIQASLDSLHGTSDDMQSSSDDMASDSLHGTSDDMASDSLPGTSDDMASDTMASDNMIVFGAIAKNWPREVFHTQTPKRIECAYFGERFYYFKYHRHDPFYPPACCGKWKLHLLDPSNELTSPRPLTEGQLNLRKCYVAAFPQLKSEEARYSTFGGWPRLHVKVRELVEAGLFYLGEEDYVQCYWCAEKFGNWNNGLDPVLEH